MTYQQLTDEERYQIEALNREGFTQKDIAKSIGRSPSTISRELRRNSGSKRGYKGALAIKRMDKRRRGSKKSEKLDLAMCSMIKRQLEDYLSPEQISGRLSLEMDVNLVTRPSIVIYGGIRERAEIYISY